MIKKSKCPTCQRELLEINRVSKITEVVRDVCEYNESTGEFYTSLYKQTDDEYKGHFVLKCPYCKAIIVDTYKIPKFSITRETLHWRYRNDILDK